MIFVLPQYFYMPCRGEAQGLLKAGMCLLSSNGCVLNSAQVLCNWKQCEVGRVETVECYSLTLNLTPLLYKNKNGNFLPHHCSVGVCVCDCL